MSNILEPMQCQKIGKAMHVTQLAVGVACGHCQHMNEHSLTKRKFGALLWQLTASPIRVLSEFMTGIIKISKPFKPIPGKRESLAISLSHFSPVPDLNPALARRRCGMAFSSAQTCINLRSNMMCEHGMPLF